MEGKNCVMLTGASGHLGVETIKALNKMKPDLRVKVLVHGKDDKFEEKLHGFNVEKIVVKEGQKEDSAWYQV